MVQRCNYKKLSGKAWVYAEELALRTTACPTTIYYLEWIQARFMEVEITKASTMMSDLFRKCKGRNDLPTS